MSRQKSLDSKPAHVAERKSPKTKQSDPLTWVTNAVVQAHGESVLVFDASQQVIAANQVAEQTFGAQKGALAGLRWYQLILSGLPTDEKTLPGQVASLHTVEAQRLDSTRFTAFARTYRLEDEPEFLGVSLLDVSEERALRKELDSTNSLAGLLVRDMSVGIVVQSALGAIIEANTAAEKILGFTREQLVGRTLVDPRVRSLRRDMSILPAHEHPSMRVLRSGGVQAELVGVERAAGIVTWIEIEARRIVDSPTSAVFASLVDVTAAREAELKMAAALARQEIMTSLSSETVLIVDADLVVRSASSNTMRLLGWSPSDLIGKDLVSWVQDDQRELVKAALSRLFSYPGARGRLDITLRQASGHLRIYDGNGMNMLADKMINGLLINLRDIHDQRMAEAAVRKANEELEHRLQQLSADRAFDAALSRVADLLQQCSGLEEAADVLWASLPTLIPGFETALYLEDSEHIEFIRHRAPDHAHVFLPTEACWALRTRRAHISDGVVTLRCDHVPQDGRMTACLPLMAAGRVVGLVVVRSPGPERPLPSQEEINRLAVRLSIVVGNSRLRSDKGA